MIYQNFDLEIISPQGGQLCARVLESPQGDCPFMRVKWPFEAQEEDELLAQIYGGLRQRRARSSKGGTIQDFGGRLFDAVFAGDIEHLFRSSLDTAFRAGKGLRIRLRLPEDSELHARPWEFLFDTECGEFLAVHEHTPLIRYLPVAKPIPPITVEGPLRVLVALSSPTDHPRLDIAREWEILCQALEPSITAGRLELRRVPGNCTFDNLRDSLRHFSTHIFHFVGHGLPGALVLEQESGRGLEMEATHLRAVFPSGALPRLIVLNACSGAISEDVPFSGLAQGFLKQGVPAVVAMQASITDDAALIFTRYFYRDLVATGAVDASLTEARLRMQGNGHPIEWGTPVLYMRALSGQLFQPPADPVEEKKPFEMPAERKKNRDNPVKAIVPPPVQQAPNPTERKRPRTARSRESQPPVESRQNLQHALPSAAPPRENSVPPEPPPKAEARLETQAPAPRTSTSKTAPPKTPAAPPPPRLEPKPEPEPRPEARLEPQLAEQAAPPKPAARKHPPASKPEPRLEPKLEPKPEPKLETRPDEPVPASQGQAADTVPLSRLPPAPEPPGRPAPVPTPKAGSPAKRKTAYARWLMIYAVGGAMLAAILVLTFGRGKPPPARKDAPPVVTSASPASPPATATAEAPPAASDQTAPRTQSSPAGTQAAVPDSRGAHAPVAVPARGAKSSPPGQHKPKPKPKTAPVDNCRNPDVSERSADCLFR